MDTEKVRTSPMEYYFYIVLCEINHKPSDWYLEVYNSLFSILCLFKSLSNKSFFFFYCTVGARWALGYFGIFSALRSEKSNPILYGSVHVSPPRGPCPECPASISLF